MSNYLDFAVKSETQIMDWVLMQLGYPLIQVEIHEDQLRMCINDAVEEFTKWVIQEKKYLALNLEYYTQTTYGLSGEVLVDGGYNLSTLTNNIPVVTSVFTIQESTGTSSSINGHNTLFSVTNTMWNQGVFPIPGQSGGGSGAWINYELALSYVELIKRMTASGFQYEFNERTQKLTLRPDPKANGVRGYVCIGCNVIRPDDQQYGESWIKRYALACAKIIVGRIREKYSGTQLLGGGSINSDIKQEGIEEKQQLLEEIRETYTYCDFFVGG